MGKWKEGGGKRERGGWQSDRAVKLATSAATTDRSDPWLPSPLRTNPSWGAVWPAFTFHWIPLPSRDEFHQSASKKELQFFVPLKCLSKQNQSWMEHRMLKRLPRPLVGVEDQFMPHPRLPLHQILVWDICYIQCVKLDPKCHLRYS